MELSRFLIENIEFINDLLDNFGNITLELESMDIFSSDDTALLNNEVNII